MLYQVVYFNPSRVGYGFSPCSVQIMQCNYVKDEGNRCTFSYVSLTPKLSCTATYPLDGGSCILVGRLVCSLSPSLCLVESMNKTHADFLSQTSCLKESSKFLSLIFIK